jgi:hypothetical protein
MAIGRISGPMLFSNLERQGIDLAFEGNLIYLDVTNSNVGINTSTPNADLQVVGTANLANIIIDGNTIASTTGKVDLGYDANLVIRGGSPSFVLSTDGAGIVSWASIGSLAPIFGNIQLVDDTVSILKLNGNLNLQANGTGNVVSQNDFYAPNLYISGTGTFGGNVTAPWFLGNIIAPNGEFGNSTISTNLYVGSTNVIGDTKVSLHELDIINNEIIGRTGNLLLSANIEADGNAVVRFTGNAAIDIPTGNTSQRPDYPDLGYIRYNIDYGSVEWWGGESWVQGAQAIQQQVITPDGVSNAYNLLREVTKESILVSINGTVQQAGVSYDVSPTQIIFSEIPLATDIIDIRYLASGVAAAVFNGGNIAGPTYFLDSTSSISANTGAVVIVGGLGVNGNIFAGGNLVAASGVASTNPTTGAIVIVGGAGITGSMNVGGNQTIGGVFVGNGNIVANSGTSSTDTVTGALVVKGGAGVSGNLNVGGNITVTGNLDVLGNVTFYNQETVTGVEIVGGNVVANSGVASTSVDTGALVVNGGVGIDGDLTLGGNATILSTILSEGNIVANSGTASTSIDTGALVVIGGAGVTGNLRVGEAIWSVGNIHATSLSSSIDSATGALVVLGGVGIGGNLSLDGRTIANLIPGTDNFYSLGSSVLRWKNFHLAGTLTQDGTATINGGLLTTSVIASGDVSGSTITGTIATVAQPNITQLGTITSGTWNGGAIGVAYGGTGATSTTQALTNLLPAGGASGYVLTTGGSGSYYWAAGTGGGGGGGGTLSGIFVETSRTYYTATLGQTNFTTTGNFTPGTGQLRIYQNGVRQFASEYTELTANTFSLSTACAAGDVILAEIDGYNYLTVFASNVVYSPSGGIPLTSNTVQLALDNVENRKVDRAGDTMTGPLLIANTTQAISTTTGALKVQGGVSIESGNLFIGGASGNAITATGNISTVGNIYGTRVFSLGSNVLIPTSNVSTQVASLGVGTPASGVGGEVRATGDVIAYYSDDRLKTRLGNIEHALDKVKSLAGFHYHANELAQSLGYEPKPEVGVSAQEVQKIFPEIVVPAPIDENYLTVKYEKLIPVLIEAIKELSEEIEAIKRKI